MAKTTPELKTVSDSTKEAFVLFQNMQKMANINELKLGSQVLSIPQPYSWNSTDKATGVVTPKTSYSLNFGFVGGSLRVKVSEEIYHSAQIGDSFLLEGYIKATGEQKTYKDKESGSENEFVTITLNPEITKVTPLNSLVAFGYDDDDKSAS